MNLMLWRSWFSEQKSQYSEKLNRVKVKVGVPLLTQEVIVLWSMGLLGTRIVWVMGGCSDP